MKVKIINQLRTYYEDCTVSNIFLPDKDKQFCYGLEDVGRPVNVKVYGKTCIPEGVYEVDLTYSPKYKKKMILLSNSEDGSVNRAGIRFTGLRVHSGNTVDHSEGCVLVAYNFDGGEKIWQTASYDLHKEVSELLEDCDKLFWVVSSY